MSRMRQTTAMVSSSGGIDHESSLDALLDDLQTTVSRTGSNLNLNGHVTGYREIRRTVTDTAGDTSSEYQIEYINPANTTTHLAESLHHNGSGALESHNKSSIKEYKYGSSEATGTRGTDLRLKKNISDLDSLLDDLNTAQNKGFSESGSTSLVHHSSGVDPGLIEPSGRGSQELRRVEERHYREEKRLRGRSSSPRRELVFTGNRSRDPSPMGHNSYITDSKGPIKQQFYRYEKTTTSRTTAPVITDITPADHSGVHALNYTSVDDNSHYRPHSPSPARHVQTYHYSSSNHDQTTSPPAGYSERVAKYSSGRNSRDPSPQRGKTSQSYSYSSSSTRESRSEVPRTPPPHRSPSPVSFTQPPLPNTKKSFGYDPNYLPRSPSPTQKFSPSDPSRKLTYNVSPPQSSVVTYKYSSTTSSSNKYPEEAPLLPRPFPNPSPPPEQQPPKKLDELMASFSDVEQSKMRNESSVHYYHSQREHRQTPKPEKVEARITSTEKLVEKSKEKPAEESKNISGPPVYYPPGELFAKKEESMSQQQSGGGKYKAKGKYKYEESSKSKMSEGTKMTMVPVCLPLCCGLPCTIM